MDLNTLIKQAANKYLGPSYGGPQDLNNLMKAAAVKRLEGSPKGSLNQLMVRALNDYSGASKKTFNGAVIAACKEYEVTGRSFNTLVYKALHKYLTELPPPPAPSGQQLFTSSGNFVVPDGVTSICAVAIGIGRTATDQRNGTGGALAFVNDSPVTPGETIEVYIDTSSSRLERPAQVAFLSAGAGRATAPGIVIAGTGFPGGGRADGGASSSGLARNGSGAGGYTSEGQTASDSSINSGFGGGGSSPYGGASGADQGVSPNSDGAPYGGGGGKFYTGTTLVAGAGGPGCVRIIWGPGRAFPNTNTADV